MILIGEGENREDAPYIVYVLSSDIHTDFIFPLKNELFDWSSVLPLEKIFKANAVPSYVSIGWGSKEFFFKMKTWADFKLDVFLRAIFVPSESTVHVDFFDKIPTNEVIFKLRLKKSDYLKLVHFALGSFLYDKDHKLQQIGEFSYYGADRFFKGSKKYHAFNTCNMWTTEGLHSINWKRPLWSPFKYGIEYALRDQR